MIFLLFFIITCVDTMISASALHGECHRNEQCGTFDTYCKNGTCVCREHFTEVFDTCIQLATPRITCTHKSQCKATLGGRSMCKDAQCACKSFHHIQDGQCIKSRGLDEVCESDEQCYCGKDCNDKVECFRQFCRCKLGFVQQGRRCIFVNQDNDILFSSSSLRYVSVITTVIINFVILRII